MTSFAGLLTWFGISFMYIRFYAGMEAQGIDRRALPFSDSPLVDSLSRRGMPPSVASSFVLCVPCGSVHSFVLDLTLLLQLSGWSVFLRGEWNNTNFVTKYLSLILFPILYIASKLWTHVPTVEASQMDSQYWTSGDRGKYCTYDVPPPKNKLCVLGKRRFSAFWLRFVHRPLNGCDRCITTLSKRTYLMFVPSLFSS